METTSSGTHTTRAAGGDYLGKELLLRRQSRQRYAANYRLCLVWVFSTHLQITFGPICCLHVTSARDHWPFRLSEQECRVCIWQVNLHFLNLKSQHDSVMKINLTLQR